MNDSLEAFSLVISFIYDFLSEPRIIWGFELSFLEIFLGSVLLGIAGYVTFRILD